jgi:hypothetical protein
MALAQEFHRATINGDFVDDANGNRFYQHMEQAKKRLFKKATLCLK